MDAAPDQPCCSPQRTHHDAAMPTAPGGTHTPSGTVDTSRWIALGPDEFTMGEDGPWAYPDDGETVRRAAVAPFTVAPMAVSNADFARFAAATGYRTEAEQFGWSFVFGGLLPDDFPDTRGVAAAPWWRQVEGSSWRHPEGPHSNVSTRPDHPVVHVSWHDTQHYCAWAGVRLATEAEWEYAARGGATTTFPWGDELEPQGEHRMNVFQGTFPSANTGADGFLGTCPVDAFAPNGFGLYNTVGNVWEWTASQFAPSRPGDALYALKGGSYLCHASYCRRYRPAARMGSTPDSSAGNIGFRCVA